MAAFSMAGVGSGFDVANMVSQIGALERAPISRLKVAQTKMQSQLSGLGLIKSYVNNIKDAANALTKPDLWGATKVSSSDDTRVKATSTSGAAAGQFAVEVTQLAQAQTATSSKFAVDQTFGAGSLVIKVGSKDAVSIDMGSGNLTLDQVAKKINDAKTGVSASVVSDASGKTLIYQAKEAGTANSFTVGVGAGSDPSLEFVSFNMSFSSSRMAQTRAAQEAKAKVNDVEVTSSTNTFKNVLQGVDLTVSKLTEASQPVTLTVSDDQEKLIAAMENMVKMYNDFSTFTRDQTRYDSASKKAGALQGDSAVINIQRQLRSSIMEPTEIDGKQQVISNFGISIGNDGKISFDKTKFASQLAADPAGTRAAFAADDSSGTGFMKRLSTATTSLLSSGGVLEARTEGINSLIKRNTQQQDRVEERAVRIESNLRNQFQRLDETMSKNSALQSYVTQQMASISTWS